MTDLKLLESASTGLLDEISAVYELIAVLWEECELVGYDDGGMTTDKLYRAEHISWEPPLLSFRIERHSAIVGGGPKKAEYQVWTFNVPERTKTWSPDGYRLMEPLEPRIKVAPLAEEYADLAVNRQLHHTLIWVPNGEVRINIALVPGLWNTNEHGRTLAKETIDGRRRRFRKAFESILLPKGWSRIRANVYAPPANTQH